MIKVYFDTNIYTSLGQPEHGNLLKLLVSSKNSALLFMYSDAHLKDLHRDKSQRKYADLDFIETISENNFLSYEGERDTIAYQYVTPKEAYKYFRPSDQSFEDMLSSVFEDIEDDSLLIILRDLFENQVIDLKIDENLANQPDEVKQLYKRLGLEKSKYNLLEWMSVAGKLMDRFTNDNTIIKDIRRYSKEYLKIDKFNLNIDEVDFSQKLSKTAIRKSFLEFLEDNLAHLKDKDGKISLYNRLTTSFSLLNFYGFDNEKNKKVKFTSTTTDAEHYYYSMYCDVVVSDDAGFVQKAKFLNNVFGIDISVKSLDEFHSSLPMLTDQSFTDAASFFDVVRYEMEKGLVVNATPSIQFRQNNQKIRMTSKYFGIFNYMSIVEMHESGEQYIVLFNDVKRYYHPVFYKDFRSTTNKLFKLFGLDDDFKGQFSEDEMSEVEDSSWAGRHWTIGGLTVRLIKNFNSHRINLLFGPLKK